MSNVVSNVVVQDTGTKEVKTRFGIKKTYSFQAGGQWYKTGFTDPKLSAGEVVSFEYVDGSYGKEVDAKTIKTSGAAAAPAPSASPRPAYNSGKGVFPIPPLDGQRSIVRQNALTNARELLATLAAAATQKVDFSKLNDEMMASRIIALAQRFESYTAGDMDMEAASKSLEGDKAE